MLIGLCGLGEEVVKLQRFLFAWPSKLQPRAVTFGSDAPMRPFKAQLADESVQKPPCSKKVPGSEVIG